MKNSVPIDFEYDPHREIGGILLGKRREDGLPVVTQIVQFKNCSADPESKYILPHGLKVTVWIYMNFIKKLLTGKFSELSGLELVGEWHSHPSGTLKPSKADKELIQKKANVKGDYLLGIAAVVRGRGGKPEPRMKTKYFVRDTREAKQIIAWKKFVDRFKRREDRVFGARKVGKSINI